MDIKYIVKNKEELEFLEKAYKKLLNYYEIEVDNNELNLEHLTLSVWVYPSGLNSKITKVQKRNLEDVTKCDEDYCKSCSPEFLEREHKFGDEVFYYEIIIRGTSYSIRVNHKHNHNC